MMDNFDDDFRDRIDFLLMNSKKISDLEREKVMECLEENKFFEGPSQFKAT